jgi:predicted metal-dependent phosphoesterase TrpH
MSPWLRVEFHCHTVYSRDSLSRIPDLLQRVTKKGIDRIIITDHNSIRGALEAQALDPERVIVGEEILTDKGELLAAYVKEEIPRGLPALEVIDRLRQQGAFISVSHPFDLRRHGWQLNDLEEIAPLVDAIEIFNARCVDDATNTKAMRFAEEHGLGGTAGSDAHSLIEVGNANLLLPPFSNADELRQVIREGKLVAMRSQTWMRFSSFYARFYKAIRSSRA